jgi:hypothetical protein
MKIHMANEEKENDKLEGKDKDTHKNKTKTKA